MNNIIKCRECDKPATWVLTNITVSNRPFLCGRHVRKLPYDTMNKMGFKQKKLNNPV